MFAVVAVGFAPSFYLGGIISAPHPFEPLTPLVLLHGLLFTAFLMLFTAQVWLVAAGRSDVHRKLGRVAFILVPVMIVVGVVTGLGGVSRPLTAPPGISPLSWLAVPLLDVPVFGTLLDFGARKPFPAGCAQALHVHCDGRYDGARSWSHCAVAANPSDPGDSARELRHRVRASCVSFWPLCGSRLRGQIFLPALFLMALIAWDYWSRGRPHRISIVASSAVIAVAAVKPTMWSTLGRLHFAEWVSAAFR